LVGGSDTRSTDSDFDSGTCTRRSTVNSTSFSLRTGNHLSSWCQQRPRLTLACRPNRLGCDHERDLRHYGFLASRNSTGDLWLKQVIVIVHPIRVAWLATRTEKHVHGGLLLANAAGSARHRPAIHGAECSPITLSACKKKQSLRQVHGHISDGRLFEAETSLVPYSTRVHRIKDEEERSFDACLKGE
jgi:hypothetical protein